METIWDNTAYEVLIGEHSALVVSNLRDANRADNHVCAIIKYPHKETLHSLRWRVGAVVDLHTADLVTAQETIQAMVRLEGQSNE